MEPYGLPPGTDIRQGALGFPAWVDDLCRQWGIDSSTYAGHQESDRPDIGSAPNPYRLNRGIDWWGDPGRLLAFARALVAVAPPRTAGQYGPPGLEMVIYQDPRDGTRVWYPSWVNYGDDFGNHTDHVHTRQSASFAVPGGQGPAGDPLVAALQAKGFSPALIRLIRGFSVVEGLNPAGNPTLGWTDAQLGGDSSLQGHVDALARQFIDRRPVAGDFPEGGDDLAQARWIAKVVGQEGLPSDWQGNPQPTDYVQRVVNAMQRFPLTGPTEGGDLTAEQDKMLREIHAALFNLIPSQSPYRWPGEGAVWRLHELIKNDDGKLDRLDVEDAARQGDPEALARLRAVAGCTDPDRAADAARAQRFLGSLTQVPPPASGGSPAIPGTTTPPVSNLPATTTPPGSPTPQNGVQGEKIVLLTFSGHLADMFTGYQADLARAMDPDVFYWQPVGNWDPTVLPMGPPCDDAYREGIRLLREVHPSGPFALAGYSQGAIPASRLYMALTGELADRRDDFVGGVTWGNPYREQGHYEGSKPVNGHGISGVRIQGTGPRWHDYADPGDIYTNVSGPSGLDCTAIYDMAMRLDPTALMARVLAMFINPAPELMAMVQAIVMGLQFGISSPPTAAHIQYQWRECEPGITYFDHSVRTMRAIGARTRS